MKKNGLLLAPEEKVVGYTQLGSAKSTFPGYKYVGSDAKSLERVQRVMVPAI